MNKKLLQAERKPDTKNNKKKNQLAAILKLEECAFEQLENGYILAQVLQLVYLSQF